MRLIGGSVWLSDSVLSLDAHTRVYVAAEPLDFRKQIDGLALAVQEVLELDPFSAHLFVFTNRTRDKLKALYWHHNGYMLLYKRLEKGRFHWPDIECDTQLSVSTRELQWLLEGRDLQSYPTLTAVQANRI